MRIVSSFILPTVYIPEKPPEIKLSEVWRYLGYGGHIPDSATVDLTNQCTGKLRAVMRPRVLYAEFPLLFQPDGVLLDSCNLILPGQDIAAHLSGCSKAVLLCATLSVQTDQLIRNTQIADMTAGLITDCCATAAIEQLCDDAEIVLKKHFGGSYFTSRYSPGYGDLPLDIQKDFLSVLDAPRKIGLCATDSSILTPRKSVTAVIGISKNPPIKNRTGCMHCNLRDTCEFRRKGEFCGLSDTAE